MKNILLGLMFINVIISCNQKKVTVENKNNSVESKNEIRSFRSKDPVEVQNPKTIVETVKNDSSKIELFILENSIYLSFDSKNIYFKNLDEFEKYCQKNKAIIQKRDFVIIVERSTDQKTIISFINVLKTAEIKNIAFVSKQLISDFSY